MKKTFFIGIVIILLVLPLIVAIQTKITIKTEPEKLVSIRVTDPSTDEKLVNLFERADATGLYETTVSTGIKEINIRIISKRNDNTIIGSEEINNHIAGSAISVDFVKTNVTETSSNETGNASITELNNETQNEQVTLLEDKNETKSFISSLTIFGEGSSFTKYLYYIIGGIVVIAIIGFVVARRPSFFSKNEEGGKSQEQVNVKKMSDFQKEQRERAVSRDEEIIGAEKKLRAAQAELEKIKTEDRIKKEEDMLRRKIEEDRERLRRLREGR